MHRTNLFHRAASSVRRLFAREEPAPRTEQRTEPSIETSHARAVRRESDIPLDRIEKTYIPKQTSVKASFRATGDDHQRDQEFSSGVADDRWSDEDRLTNKSGDPRIGTHGRTYEPGE